MSRESNSALLLLNGEIADPALIRRLARRCALVICADGGARHARLLRLVPDAVVGDMDSLPRPLPRAWARTLYCCDFNEDASDFEKSVIFARRTGCRRLYAAGLLGGRLDHVMVNLALVRRFAEAMDLVAVDRGLAFLRGSGRHRFPWKRGQIFSLLAATPRALLSVAGGRYALRRAVLRPGSRGLSNVALGPVDVTVHSGRVWIMGSGLDI